VADQRAKKEKEEIMKLWVQKWEESERGWGTRPDGYTLHATKEHVDHFLKDMRKREMEGMSQNYVPESYSRPDGSDPYEWECDDQELVSKVTKSKNGIWGSGKNPPKPKEGTKISGWIPADWKQ
jgi:hypothetical protein